MIKLVDVYLMENYIIIMIRNMNTLLTEGEGQPEARKKTDRVLSDTRNFLCPLVQWVTAQASHYDFETKK